MTDPITVDKKELSVNEISTPALAYLGDCVLELLVRRHLVLSGIGTAKNLNKTALEYVCAPAQAEAVKNILPLLTEEEEGVFHRGRNAGHGNTPKSATMAEYRAATGMEALFGFLHLAGRKDRIDELFSIAYPNEIIPKQ